MMDYLVIAIVAVVVAGVLLLAACRKDPPKPPMLCTPPADWTEAGYLACNPDVAQAVAAGATTALKHWCEYGEREGRKYQKDVPPTPPPADQSIVDFDRVSALDGNQAYFSYCPPFLGTYGRDHSNIRRDDGQLVQSVQAESVFQIVRFRGDYYATLEHGEWEAIDRGQIWKLTSGKFRKIYSHPSWNLMLYPIEHQGALWVAGCNYGTGKRDAGVVRSADGSNWSSVWNNADGISLWTPFLHAGGLYFAATTGNTDWGDDARPALARWTGSGVILEYTDPHRPGKGFWSGCSFRGKRYLGGSGNSLGDARIWCMEDARTVFQSPKHNVIHWMGAHNGIMWALLSTTADSGAEVWATKDGRSWTNVGGPFSCPLLFHAVFSDDGALTLVGGKWRGYGRVYQSRWG